MALDFPTESVDTVRLSRYHVGIPDKGGSTYSVALPVSAEPRWTVADITSVILELLGDLLGERPFPLRARLLAKGAHMPIDSLDLFDVLAEFRQRTGITIPKRKLGSHTMRSITSFSQFIAKEAQR